MHGSDVFYWTTYDSCPQYVKLLLGQRQIMTSVSKEESSIKELPWRGDTEKEDLMMLKLEIFI